MLSIVLFILIASFLISLVPPKTVSQPAAQPAEWVHIKRQGDVNLTDIRSFLSNLPTKN